MKGKRSDPEFISDFISNCIKNGIETPENIINIAKKKISEIDDEIKRVEQQKIIRSKLLDVVSSFEKPIKSTHINEIKALEFFKIQNSQICYYICTNLKRGVQTIESLSGKYQEGDLIFCIKQLLEHKVICKSGAHILRGEMFDEYVKYIFKEI